MKILNIQELLKQYSDGKRDFSNIDLRHIKIPYGCNLQGIDFSGSNLRGVEFFDVNMENANFKNADLRQTKLSGLLDNANFSKADLRQTSFGGYVGKDIKFINSNISNTDFYKVRLDGSDLSYAKLNNSQFFQCSFEQTDFSFSNLSNSIMTECILDGADFSNANLSKSYLEGYFRNVSFKNTNLQYSILLFYNDLLDISDWKNSILEQTIFFGCFYHPNKLLGKLNFVYSSKRNWIRSKSDLNLLNISNYNFDAISKLRHLLEERDLCE